MSKNWRTRIIVVLLILGVLIVGLVIFLALNKPEEKKPSALIPNTSKYQRVFIKDIHLYVDDKTKDSVERTLYNFFEKETPTIYTGTIRPESHSQRTVASGQEIINLMVDIRPVESTYKLTLISYQGVYSVNIECAPKEQQLKPSWECKDIYSHE
jgi:hypothetical protein